jgi:hypothetical protein
MTSWLGLLLTVIGGLAAAGFGIVASAVNDGIKDRRNRRTRFDAEYLKTAMEFTAKVRLLEHLSGRFSRIGDPTARAEALKSIDQAHADLRTAFDQMSLIGSKKTMMHAAAMRSEVYWMREVEVNGKENKSDVAWDGDPRFDFPAGRLEIYTANFTRSFRAQLNIPSLDGVYVHNRVLSNPLKDARDAADYAGGGGHE